MSVIVAIKDKKRIVVGVDVRMSASDSYNDSYSRRPKAVHLNKNNDIIVGAVGNVGLLDILKQQLSEYQEKDLYKIDKSFIIKYIMPALVVNVKDFEMRDRDGKMDGVLFLAVQDKGYFIMGNYTVEEVVDYAAEGSGRDAALGSLYTSSRLLSISPEEKIRLSIESAGACVNTVSKISFIGDTAGKRFTSSDLKNSK